MTDAGAGERAFAVVAGGGTGGHVYPALALARALVARGHPAGTIRFVGARRGLEASAVPASGFDVELMPGRGLQRRLTVANLRAAWEALVALVASFRLLGRWRPRVVVGFGGYASLPCLVAARLRRLPTVVHEQNAAPGLANRLAVRMGARAAVALEGTPLRGATVTGNPVRPEIVAVERDPDPDRATVVFVGGSLGARRLNQAALGLYDRWRRRTDRAVVHVSGRRDHDDCRVSLEGLRRPGDALRYDLVGYEEHMERLYARAAVVVCRAGALTVAELAASGTPAVLVPLPGAPGDHQARNARAMVDAGAAVLVTDADCDAPRLDTEVGELLARPDRLATMGSAARAMARPDAAERLADVVEEVARGVT